MMNPNLEHQGNFKGQVSAAEEAFKARLAKLVAMCPSDDTLCDVFLKDFHEIKVIYEDDMRSITAKALMADHTFKV